MSDNTKVDDNIDSLILKYDEINKEQRRFYDAYRMYNKLQNDKESIFQKIQKICPHEICYRISTEHDAYEGRTYAKYQCEKCGNTWEERVICGRFKYPVKEKD